MIEEVMKNICEKNGLKQISGTTLTFIDSTKSEGVDLWANKPRTFFVRDFQKIYEEPPSDKIQKILFEIQKSISDIQPEKKPEKQPEKHPEAKTEVKNEVKNEPDQALMPEKIHDSLYEKWQALPVSKRLIMLQKTDKRFIQEKKGRGGKMQSYVEGHYMVMAANMAFGFQWGSHVKEFVRTDKEIICIGYIETMIDNQKVVKSAVGQKDISFRQGTNEIVCIGDDYKAAETDMLKKALWQFGIAGDVYRGDV